MDIATACKATPWSSLINHLTCIASQTIQCTPSSPSSRSTCSTWPLTLTLTRFAHRVVARAPVSTAAILGASVYLIRVKYLLPPSARGIESTHHRLLFASLLIASKMLHDYQIKNSTWGHAIGISLAEVNLMERQLLTLLNYNLCLQTTDLNLHLNQVIECPTMYSLINKTKLRSADTWPRMPGELLPVSICESPSTNNLSSPSSPLSFIEMFQDTSPLTTPPDSIPEKVISSSFHQNSISPLSDSTPSSSPLYTPLPVTDPNCLPNLSPMGSLLLARTMDGFMSNKYAKYPHNDSVIISSVVTSPMPEEVDYQCPSISLVRSDMAQRHDSGIRDVTDRVNPNIDDNWVAQSSLVTELITSLMSCEYLADPPIPLISHEQLPESHLIAEAGC